MPWAPGGKGLIFASVPPDTVCPRTVHAMVLCAGLGTRLRPLTDERPKPLVPVNNQPLASHALAALAAVGVRHVVANAFHLAHQIDPGLRPWTERHGMELTVLTESRLLGTGGGIRNALPYLAGDFVVFNGDVLAAPDLPRALAVHRSTGARVTMVLREDPRAGALGAIEVTEDHRVARILDEGPRPAEPVRRCLFTGVYVVASSVADDLPAEGCVVRHTLRRLLARGERVSGVVDTGPWYDLGTVRSYAEAQFALLRGEIPLAGWTAPAGAVLVGQGAELGPGVAVGREVCVGSGARIEGRGEVGQAIVWDGAAAVAPATRVIVSRTARVPVPAG